MIRYIVKSGSTISGLTHREYTNRTESFTKTLDSDMEFSNVDLESIDTDSKGTRYIFRNQSVGTTTYMIDFDDVTVIF